jgi:tryptophanyl-tRNA synthetase
MSKSQGPQSYVSLSDSSDMIEKKIMSAVTDSNKEIIFDPKNRKAISNLMALYYLTTGESLENIQNKYKKIQNYSEFKQDLTQEIIKFLKPFQQKKQEILKDKNKIKKILADGAKKAQIEAQKNIIKIKNKMGLK